MTNSLIQKKKLLYHFHNVNRKNFILKYLVFIYFIKLKQKLNSQNFPIKKKIYFKKNLTKNTKKFQKRIFKILLRNIVSSNKIHIKYNQIKSFKIIFEIETQKSSQIDYPQSFNSIITTQAIFTFTYTNNLIYHTKSQKHLIRSQLIGIALKIAQTTLNELLFTKVIVFVTGIDLHFFYYLLFIVFISINSSFRYLRQLFSITGFRI